MTIIHPNADATPADILSLVTGRFIVLNVVADGQHTSICGNIQADGAGRWVANDTNRRMRLDIARPPFSFTDRTLVLPYEDVNVLANNFEAIRQALPAAAFRNGTAAIGSLSQSSKEMRSAIAGLEQRTPEIMAVMDALNISLDTSLYQLRRDVPRSVPLTNGNALTAYGESVLSEFSPSQATYARLPELRGFGTDNTSRRTGRPGKRDAQLRWYMQHNSSNPLATNPTLNFVSYELKPLHIADKLKWKCSFDPRTESIDLLLCRAGAPVLTEVKMAGDKFVSSAVVQLLYYASIMANPSQRTRLEREIDGFTQPGLWLCVIAEERTAAHEAGFDADERATVAFLRHSRTKEVLSPSFGGCSVVVIREEQEPFCKKRDIPSFRVVAEREHHVEW